MTTDPRSELEGGAPEVPGWLSLRDVVLALCVGLVLAAGLAVLTPGSVTHLRGGTDERETTVVAVREGTAPGDEGEEGKVRTTYDLTWRADGEVGTATFHRSGRPDHEVGDTWALWVSPDGSVVETTSPRTTWLGLGLGMPAFVLVIGLLVRWRGRVVAQAPLREADRIERERERRAPRDT